MKVAIWGAGKMGQVHGQAYKGMGKDVEIAYIVERDAGKAAEFSGRFRCRAIDDVSGLEGKHIDMIDICLPTYLHREAIEQALDPVSYTHLDVYKRQVWDILLPGRPGIYHGLIPCKGEPG